MARFYAAPLAKGTQLDFDLVVLPSESKSSSGEQLLAHSVIELAPGEAANERMDVVCHELFHFFYGARTSAQQAALAKRFVDDPDSDAAIALALLNEAVATALGNGVVDQLVNPKDYEARLSKDAGLYNNHAIDATAKGVLQRTHGDPSRESALDDAGFVRMVIDSTRAAVGDDPRPAEFLRVFSIMSLSGWGEVRDALMANASDVDSYPVDAAFSAGLSIKSRRAIVSAAKTHRAFAWIERKNPKSRLFVLVADDAQAAVPVVDALLAEKQAVLGLYEAKK